MYRLYRSFRYGRMRRRGYIRCRCRIRAISIRGLCGVCFGQCTIDGARTDRSTGTTRALIQNQILGVSEGHSTILRLVGVGYRATVEDKAVTKQPEYPGQKFVSLKVGYSHPIELGVPEGVKASTPQPTRILLESCEKDTMKRFAAEIREWRKPEPYKGKGIFIDGETIKLKAKKIK